MAKKKKISEEQKALIIEAWNYCDEEDKSTEFMLQYMSDTADVDYDIIVAYICSEQASIDRQKLFKKNK